MNKFMIKYFSLPAIFVVITILCSCMDEDEKNDTGKPDIQVTEIVRDGGVIILNEGNFMYGNSSVTYYNPKKKEEINDVFYRQNGVPLGDVAESAVIHNGELYIVLNNSGKVVTVNFGKYPDLSAFEFTQKITGLSSPRYIHFLNNEKAYITDLYSKKISILNPGNYTVTGYIDVDNKNPGFIQHPTEQIIPWQNYVFTNCFSYDNKVLVINTGNDLLVDSIEVLAQPNSMVLDRNGKLWVLCDGGYEGSAYANTVPGLVRIDAETRTVEKVFVLPGESWPSALNINGGKDTLYFINKDIYRMPVIAGVLPSEPFIPAGPRLLFGLGVNPLTSEIYVTDAIDHVQNGVIYRYSPDGEMTDKFKAGISPRFFVFTGGDSK